MACRCNWLGFHPLLPALSIFYFLINYKSITVIISNLLFDHFIALLFLLGSFFGVLLAMKTERSDTGVAYINELLVISVTIGIFRL